MGVQVGVIRAGRMELGNARADARGLGRVELVLAHALRERLRRVDVPRDEISAIVRAAPPVTRRERR